MALLAELNLVRRRSGDSDVFELGNVAFEDHLSPFFVFVLSAEPCDRNLLSVSDCVVSCSEI